LAISSSSWFLYFLFLFRNKKKKFFFRIGSAPTSLVVIAMRDPTLNDDELQTRMTTLRDSSTTKYIQLMGLVQSLIKKLIFKMKFSRRS